MAVTIVANEFSKETVKVLQEEVDKLEREHRYSAHAIMYHLAQKGFCVSLYSANGKLILNCKSAIKF